MADRNSSDFGSFVSGFLMGGLIGSAVALLMAPPGAGLGRIIRPNLLRRIPHSTLQAPHRKTFSVRYNRF